MEEEGEQDSSPTADYHSSSPVDPAQMSEAQIRKDKEEKAIARLKDRIPDITNIFNIHGRIGSGTFSTVLLASLKCRTYVEESHNRMFAIKHLIPTIHPDRIQMELKCLVEIGGKDNIVGVDLCLRRNESVCFVMPYMEHHRFHHYYDKMTVPQVQNYMKNLLIALQRVHKFKVIHRDIKPSNFLHNRETGRFMLIDFGLAQYVDTTRKSVSVPSGSSSVTGNEVENKRKTTEVESPIDTKRQRESNPEKKSSPIKMPLTQSNEISPTKALVKDSANQIDPTKETANLQLVIPNANKTLDLLKRKATPSTSTTANDSSLKSPAKCNCYGKSQVCTICLIRKEIPACRAGTPGYRPPEVLLKYVQQTTAVDIWAAGVIFLVLLCSAYPLFEPTDDFMALAEIVSIFGDQSIRRTASALDRNICMIRKCAPLNLHKLCVRVRNRKKLTQDLLLAKIKAHGNRPLEKCMSCHQLTFDCLCMNSKYKTDPIDEDTYPASAYDLLKKLLEVNPHKRITAEDALKHKFLTENLS